MKAPELPALTGIRFFAATMVFLAHISNLPGKAWFAPRSGLGNFGVAVFFVLSGFILTYNYASLFGNGVSLGNYVRFIWDRLSKVYPLYLLTLLLAIPIELIGHNRDWSWGALVLQLTLLQCILPVNQLDSTNHLNVPGWSISCEMFFYLFAPLLIWLGVSVKRLGYVVILGWLAAVVLAVITGIWAIHASAWPGRFAPARSSEFIAGVITAVCYIKCRIPPWFVIQFCVAGGLIMLILSLFSTVPIQCLQFGFLCAPGAALLIYGLAYGQGWLAKFLSHPWMILLGTSSFAFYLIHDLVLRLFKGAFVYCHLGANNFLSAAGITVASFVLIQIVSIWLFKTVEIPVQKYLRGLARKKNPAGRL